MVDNIQFAFQQNMETISWMDEASRSAALRKIKVMKKYIGFPKWLPQKEVLEEFYAGVSKT